LDLLNIGEKKLPLATSAIELREPLQDPNGLAIVSSASKVLRQGFKSMKSFLAGSFR